jgi:hypothetical protein
MTMWPPWFAKLVTRNAWGTWAKPAGMAAVIADPHVPQKHILIVKLILAGIVDR